MNQIQRTQSKGFTFIELMITVAIVGILAAVAIPAYQDYTARAQLSEGLNLVSGAKTLVAEYHANHGTFPASMAEVGYTGAVGKYISQTTIDPNGNISATFGSNANSNIAGKTLSLSPKVQSEGNLSWDCESDAKSKYLPSSCISTDSENNNDGSTPSTPTPFNSAWTANYGASTSNPIGIFHNGLLEYNYATGLQTLTPTLSADGTTMSYTGMPAFTNIQSISVGNDHVLNKNYINDLSSNDPYKITGGQVSDHIASQDSHAYGINRVLSYTYDENGSQKSLTAITQNFNGYSNAPSYWAADGSTSMLTTNLNSAYSALVNSLKNKGNITPDATLVANYNNYASQYVSFLTEQQNHGVTLNGTDVDFLNTYNKGK